eukprot:gb/GEZN01023058.1/.p1 GENE.gb/GEZN01023058.1/~~gb/GEZN01023058.1/.p1  ORF type:complete len:164 (-),score=14.43 gb/GEZN01023058.1/:76-567(-)
MKRKERYKVVEEIVQSEQRYVEALQQLIRLFDEPLNPENAERPPDAPKITTDQHKQIFSALRSLIPVNEQFLKDLEQRHGEAKGEEGEGACVGDLLFNYSQYFKTYTSYVATYSDRSALVAKLSEGKSMQQYCLRIQKECNVSLPSLLISPIQRIPRHSLLTK